jgi:hypothetical protein
MLNASPLSSVHGSPHAVQAPLSAEKAGMTRMRAADGNPCNAGRANQMFSFYLKKTFVDYEPGIDLVNIHYTWTPLGQLPN